jgi:hypothetical protein
MAAKRSVCGLVPAPGFGSQFSKGGAVGGVDETKPISPSRPVAGITGTALISTEKDHGTKSIERRDASQVYGNTLSRPVSAQVTDPVGGMCGDRSRAASMGTKVSAEKWAVGAKRVERAVLWTGVFGQLTRPGHIRTNPETGAQPQVESHLPVCRLCRSELGDFLLRALRLRLTGAATALRTPFCNRII